MSDQTNQLYIGRLPSTITTEAISELIAERTGVSPVSIRHRNSYALIDLPDALPVPQAVQILNGCEVMGSQLLAERSYGSSRRNNNRLYVANIPNEYDWEEFKHFLKDFGNFQNCEKGASRSNSYSAIVSYENQEAAQKVQAQLDDYELPQGAHLKVEPAMERGRRAPQRNNDFPLRILVLSDMVGAIIGRAGGTIRQITQQSRARVDVHRKLNAGSPEKVITIYGTPENCSSACQRIMEIMQNESNATNRGEIPLKILAHNNLIGRIIGKSGTTIKGIMEQTETKVAVSSNIYDVSGFNLERVITVRGGLENISKAERLVSTKLRTSYESDLQALAHQGYAAHHHPMMGGRQPPALMPLPPPPPPPDFQKETVYVYVPNSSVGAIIGTGGCSIKDMISSSGASIKVIQPSKEEEEEALEAENRINERKVCIFGTAEAQWKAQFMVYKKVGFEGYPGVQEASLKVELFVPTNQVGRIIGKGGVHVRELQRMTRALIKFPDNGHNPEKEETAVHITGDFYSTQSAQRQIRAMVNRIAFYPERRRSPPQQN